MNPYHASIVVFTLLTGPVFAQEKPDLKDPKQKASYSIGADMGANFKRRDLDVDPKALAAGFIDAFTGKPVLTEAEMKEALNTFQKEMTVKMEAKQKEDGAKNVKE